MVLTALWLLPVVGAGLIALAHRRAAAAARLTLAVGAASLLAGVWAAVAAPTGSWSFGPGLELTVAAEGYSRVMVVLMPVIALPILAFTIATERHEGRTSMLAVMVAFVGAMQLLVVARDFLTLLIAWELVGVASWVLIGRDWRDAAVPGAARQAFITTRFGDLGLYVAAGVTLASTGSLGFEAVAGLEGGALHAVAGGVLLAAAAKSAQLPFAPWLFAAMAGPTPVSALLHSATLVAAGAYLLIVLAPGLAAVGWWLPTVAAIGLATALTGGVVATLQTHAKRVLAASTSAQYGLMFVAVGAGSTVAAGAHLVAHALLKSLLFLGAGVAIHAAGTARLGELRLGARLPTVAVLSGIGALALAAVPPLGAAWSKEAVVAAAVHASGWLGAGVLVAALLSALYAFRYHLLVFGRPRTAAPGSGGPPPSRAEHTALGALAAGTVALSVLWLPGATRPLETLLAEPPPAGAAWELVVTIALLAVAAAAAAGLARRQQLAGLALPDAVRESAADWLGLPTMTRAVVVDPLLSLTRLAARFDRQIVDAGVRLAAAIPQWLSRLLWRRAEWSLDRTVHAVAGAVLHAGGIARRAGEAVMDGWVRLLAAAADGAATGSRVIDEAGIDAAVDGTGRAVGAAGSHSQRLQTGLTHHYYVIVAVGIAIATVVLAVLR